MFPYFQIFGKTIGSYGLCAIIGLILCGVVASVLARRYQIAYEDVILLLVVIGVSLLIGGHLLFGLTNLNKLIALFSGASSYTLKQIVAHLAQYFGGMVFYGGFLGGCVGLFVYTGISKEVKRSVAFDLYAVSIPLFHVFGRIGCFLSGCCYGIESSFGFIVENNTLIPELNGVRRLPVPLFEAACNLVIFLVLLRLFLKGKESGKMIWYYMLIYPVVRFVMEFFRGDAIRGIWFGLSTSQWISIGLFVVAVWKLFLSKNKGQKSVACAGVVLAVVLLTGAGSVAYPVQAAQEITQGVEDESAPEKDATSDTGADAEVLPEDGAVAEDQTQGIDTTVTDPEDYGFNAKEKFVVFVCCLFSVALCLVIALFGNPNDRLKDKYRRARKQQLQREKRKAEMEKRAARRAEEDAKFAKEEEEYQKALAQYEEEQRAKQAAKEEKKRLKQEKKNKA